VRLDASEHGLDPLPSSHDSEASSSSHHLNTSSSSNGSEVSRHSHSSVPQPTPEPPAQSTPEQFTTPEIARPVEELARSAARLGELGPPAPSGKRQEREAATQTDSPERHDAHAGFAFSHDHLNSTRRITESPAILNEDWARTGQEHEQKPGQSSSEQHADGENDGSAEARTEESEGAGVPFDPVVFGLAPTSLLESRRPGRVSRDWEGHQEDTRQHVRSLSEQHAPSGPQQHAPSFLQALIPQTLLNDLLAILQRYHSSTDSVERQLVDQITEVLNGRYRTLVSFHAPTLQVSRPQQHIPPSSAT
jgi:hypothetical protein